jgi:hypothetical protein
MVKIRSYRMQFHEAEFDRNKSHEKKLANAILYYHGLGTHQIDPVWNVGKSSQNY